MFGTKLLTVFTIVILFSVEAWGQDPVEKSPIPSIQVTAEAIVTAQPNRAEIDIGVLTQAQTAEAAAAQNAEQLAAVLGELRKALGTQADFKTISYSINPNYRYPKEGGKPTITGYTASNIVRVNVNDLAQVGKVIDLATKSGANTIHRLQFALKDERAIQSQALREAATKARTQANALASALDLQIVRVLSVKESVPVSRPIRDNVLTARAEYSAVQTPVESGTLEVRATVTLTVEVSPK
jgi:uncharacterized protein